MPGVVFVGTIRTEIKYICVFSAAMVAGPNEPEASKRLIAFPGSENAKTLIKKSGMEPSRSRYPGLTHTNPQWARRQCAGDHFSFQPETTGASLSIRPARISAQN